jgi:hypothetical protein
MNNEEAIQLLELELASFRDESHADLSRRIGAESINCERSGARGARYQVEIQFFWDDRAGGNILVMGSIDDGGWRSFVPLSRSFIKAADGSFIGE